ncbi:MAG TPA: FKBP-type peptidyl-prolyl cis-trans isomerase [Thermoanaerobaculia bacterium]|jgi:FKBP-type peptidyl-prolyl cis-trans isomerase FklB|nr:FKBP-type peptidyl-prolyl cis-trans isomerase [Thermoanaerobaculia bacterium]
MNKPSALFLAALLAASGALFAQDKPQEKPQAQPQTGAQSQAKPAQPGNSKADAMPLQDKASYIIGLNLGRSLKSQDVPCSQDLIVQGLRDGLAGATPLLTDEQIQAAMQEFQQQMMTQQQAKMKVEGEKNLKASEEFLTQNKARKEIKTTASGLQYEVLKEGSGESPKPTDQVTVNYRGTLPNGTVFDSSYDRGEPATFPVNGVIPGWIEALQLMKPGSKYKIYLPPALAYGERGAGGDIGPNQALVFEVELISVQKTPPPAENPQGQAENPGASQEQAQPEKPPAL